MKSFIAESVTYLHPDKICDQISDRIVDACLAQDPYSRVAIETVGGHGHISIYGELTTKAELDISKFVKQHYLHLTSKHISVETHVVKQSPQISQGVNIGGAGDQGVMVGYACDENDMYIPHEMYLSRKLLAGVQIDGKSQVTITNGKIESVVLSVQNHTKTQLRRKLKELGINPNVPAYLNNTGAFTIGGFDADSGCTGRKIVVDAYGPRVPVGGGAFSGKDATKVDRSAAYMARWIALHLLYKYSAHEVLVRLGYVIGGDQPLIKQAIIDGKETKFKIDCRPDAIIERFDLRKPIYTQTAKEGHFGHIGEYAWEKDFE
jgi:S-adenosylmethionine synthetase